MLEVLGSILSFIVNKIKNKKLFIPDELITEVLSFLPVKSLMRLKCVSKPWKTLISDPIFVKLHLNRSARNKHLAVFSKFGQSGVFSKFGQSGVYFRVAGFPLFPILENTSGTIRVPNFEIMGTQVFNVLGSYNGLFCLVGWDFTPSKPVILFYLWNPATRTLSNKIEFHGERLFRWNFSFGYDNSTETYKIVALNTHLSYEVEVFSFGDNVWKNIQSFPLAPFPCPYFPNSFQGVYDAYVNGSLSWLATGKESQFVIISLHLSSETYRQLLLPQVFDKVPSLHMPTLAVLMDSLCFCHDFNGTHFIIWQMKEFGVQESWIQFLKISYSGLPSVCSTTRPRSVLFPLCLSENGDTLILAWDTSEQAILYNLRDNTAKKTEYTNKFKWFNSKEYVESLVSTC